MSDKTVVEKLREEAKHAREERGLPVYTPDQLESLADAIEREYLPKPHLDDGEPVQVGDHFTWSSDSGDHKVSAMHVQVFWNYSMDSADAEYFEKKAKRPALEVLDADGVPIRVGDTVWCIERVFGDDCECEVVDVQTNIERAIIRRTLGGADAIATPINNLTHKKPDTLERIEDDVNKLSGDYWGCTGIPCSICPAKKDGKTPRERYGTGSCPQAMTIDLLRRQREVLERDHER